MALCTNSIYVVHIQVNFNHISSSSAALLEALCALVEYDFEVQGIIVAAFYHLCALILDRNFLWCENCLLLAVPLLHHDKWCSCNSCSGAQRICQQPPCLCNRKHCNSCSAVACPGLPAALHLLAWAQDNDHMLSCGHGDFHYYYFSFRWGQRSI